MDSPEPAVGFEQSGARWGVRDAPVTRVLDGVTQRLALCASQTSRWGIPDPGELLAILQRVHQQDFFCYGGFWWRLRCISDGNVLFLTGGLGTEGKKVKVCTKFSAAMIKEIIGRLKAATLRRNEESRGQQHVGGNGNRTDKSGRGTRSELAPLAFSVSCNNIQCNFYWSSFLIDLVTVLQDTTRAELCVTK